jgi:hypothetical protein
MNGWYAYDVKGCGRKRSFPDFKVLFLQLPRGTEENHGKPQSGELVSVPIFGLGTCLTTKFGTPSIKFNEHLSENSLPPGRYLNPEPPQYEAAIPARHDFRYTQYQIPRKSVQLFSSCYMRQTYGQTRRHTSAAFPYERYKVNKTSHLFKLHTYCDCQIM